MAFRPTLISSCLFLFLCAAGSFVLAEIGCPPPESITPCVCDDRGSPRLVCSSVYDMDDLESVFKNSARYTFQEVHIRSSSFLYIPSAIFENVRINELYLEDCHLVALFRVAPPTKTLEKLQVVNTTIQRRFIDSAYLKNVTSLKTLIVNGVRITSLGSTFNKNFPNSLKRIVLRGTGIKKITSDAFNGFQSLDKLEVSFANLKNLTRDTFPRPFNVRFLYFDNNNITYIPEDLFTDMPELQFLSMKNNYITEVPEAAFGYRQTTIPFLRFDGNPLQCNCLLVWLIKNKPEIIGGTCQTPRSLMGKKLEDLLPGDFNCF